MIPPLAPRPWPAASIPPIAPIAPQRGKTAHVATRFRIGDGSAIAPRIPPRARAIPPRRAHGRWAPPVSRRQQGTRTRSANRELGYARHLDIGTQDLDLDTPDAHPHPQTDRAPRAVPGVATNK